MTAKTSNLLNILAAFGMIAAGIIAVYDVGMLLQQLEFTLYIKDFS